VLDELLHGQCQANRPRRARRRSGHRQRISSRRSSRQRLHRRAWASEARRQSHRKHDENYTGLRQSKYLTANALNI
jgi:hypothetical protein